MSKILRLRRCDWGLLALTLLTLASGIQLEGWWLGMGWIWAHIAIGSVYMALVIWHLWLHFGRRGWIGCLRRQKSAVTKWLAVFCLLTLVTALMATVHMLVTWHHAAIGGWHGKIGFVFIALATAHAAGRFRFYTR